MNDTTDHKPIALEDVELVRKYGYTVEIENGNLDTPLPHFHRLGAPDVIPPSTPLPVIHAVRFAVPCAECYPIAEEA